MIEFFNIFKENFEFNGQLLIRVDPPEPIIRLVAFQLDLYPVILLFQ